MGGLVLSSLVWRLPPPPPLCTPDGHLSFHAAASLPTPLVIPLSHSATHNTPSSFYRSAAPSTDYNATTPIYPEVSAAMQPYTSQQFGNPSSVHTYGQATRIAVDKARQQVAALINCWSDELAFTSCGTESDNWAIWGTVMARKDTVQGLPHVVTSAIEHPAVINCLQNLQQLVGAGGGGD